MRNGIVSVITAIAFLTACATFSGRMSDAKIEKLSEQCLTENDQLKPSTAKWYNLSTQERTKKKKEMDEYKKKRIELYQAIHSFKAAYRANVNPDGKCVKTECRQMEKMMKQIVAGCPSTSESFPVVQFDQP